MFIGRKSEISTLEHEYKRNGSSFVVVYGRRRIGKTTLIKEFIKDKKSLYFLATEEVERENIKYFQGLLSEFANIDYIKSIKIEEWQTAFKLIPESEEKTVIVIDEFQYLCINNKAFASIFQRIWDEILKDKNVMLIVCGSYMGMMEGLTLSYNSPLYGRRTAQIKLQPLSFSESCNFYNKNDIEQNLSFFSVTGGVPKYIEIFSQYNNLEEAILKELVRKDSFLYEEPYFLLQKEVEQLNTYFSILKVIARGNHKISKISSVLSMNASNVGKYLSVLQNLNIVKRITPVTEENPDKSKRGLYQIVDNFIDFWFKFILPSSAYIEIDKTDYVMNIIRKNFIDRHAAFVYEDVCRELLWEKELPFQPLKIGKWWDNNDEIDVVAVNTLENSILFGECKYWDSKVGVNILYELKNKAKHVKYGNGERKEFYVLFSKNGFTDELYELQAKGEVILYSNDTLYL